MHIRQPVVAPLELEREPRVIEAEQVLAGARPDVVISEVMVGVLRGIELVDANRPLGEVVDDVLDLARAR